MHPCACLLAVERADNFEGAWIFDVHASDTTQEMPSKELAKKYFPDAEARPGLQGVKAFRTTDRARSGSTLRRSERRRNGYNWMVSKAGVKVTRTQRGVHTYLP